MAVVYFIRLLVLKVNTIYQAAIMTLCHRQMWFIFVEHRLVYFGIIWVDWSKMAKALNLHNSGVLGADKVNSLVLLSSWGYLRIF